jgi:hypothetical protein
MANPTYAAKSLTRTAERAWTEQDDADLHATALWDDVSALVRRMRTGQRAWDLPAYNGDLFATDAIAGAELLERTALPDAQLAPVLVALARDPDDPSVGADFSGLEIGHLGYLYEGLLSLRLTPADRDLVYDERADRYVPAVEGDDVPEARCGDLVWLTDEGGRKSGGVYYTRTELVRHLVRGAVGPAFDRHLTEVRALAATDPTAPQPGCSTSTCSTRPAAARTFWSRSSTSWPTRSPRFWATWPFPRCARSSTACARAPVPRGALASRTPPCSSASS